MKIARFVHGEDPAYGVVTGADGEEVIAVLSGDPFYKGIDPTGEQVELSDVRLLAPVIPRSKVVGIGRNYAAHIEELGHDTPDEPLVFLKPNTSVIGPGDPIVYPPQSVDVHYEGELAVVIGRICRDVPLERVDDVIFGYTVVNDVTARDLQNKDGQWTRAKGFDSFCPLGPWIETEFDPSDRLVTTTLNGRVVQQDKTSLMLFGVPEIVAHVTSFMTLLPGDLIATGTPKGVGPMVAGDTVSVTVEGIGTLTNQVVAR